MPKKEDRGVVRNPLAPAGYVGFVGIAVDGVAVAYVIARREVLSPEVEDHCVGELWDAIDKYEAATQLARPALPIVPAPRDLRLIG